MATAEAVYVRTQRQQRHYVHKFSSSRGHMSTDAAAAAAAAATAAATAEAASAEE